MLLFLKLLFIRITKYLIKRSYLFFKAIKGKQEIDNIKKAHIYDGIALTKYLFWLKNNFYKKNITEITASEKLLEFRKEIKF